MNVPGMTFFYESFCKVKYFEASVKNKELLDDVTEILEVKPLHFISWCQTRMTHLFKASATFDEKLLAVYNMMYTNNLKPDYRDVLFAEGMFTSWQLLQNFMAPSTLIFFVKHIKRTCLTQLFTTLPIYLIIRWRCLKYQVLTSLRLPWILREMETSSENQNQEATFTLCWWTTSASKLRIRHRLTGSIILKMKWKAWRTE